jgi:hypothetical protein
MWSFNERVIVMTQLPNGNMNAPSELDRDLFPDTQAFQSAQEAWEGGTKEAQDPIGTFTGTILSAALGRAQSSGRLQISYEIEITTPGEYTGGMGQHARTQVGSRCFLWVQRSEKV